MNFSTSRRAMFSIGRMAIAVRLFSAAVMDGAPLGNAGWISILIGGVLSLPVVLMISLVSKGAPEDRPLTLIDRACGQWVRRAFCFAMCMLTVYEASCCTRLLVLSVQYVAFEQLPFYSLDIITILVACLGCLCGATGLSGASYFARYAVFCSFVFMLTSQFSAINWRWLAPVLGPGLTPLWHAGLSYAGILTSVIVVWLLMDEEHGVDRTGGMSYKKTGPFYILKLLGTITLACALAMILLSMLVPVVPGAPNERDFAIDKLLANGRNATSIQFLLMVVWFISGCTVIPFYIFASSSLLNSTVPVLPPKLCVVICSAATLFLTLSNLADRNMIDKVNAMIRFPVFTAVTLAICAVLLIRQRKGGRKLAPQK